METKKGHVEALIRRSARPLSPFSLSIRTQRVTPEKGCPLFVEAAQGGGGDPLLVGDLDPLETEFLYDPRRVPSCDPSFTTTISTRGKRRRRMERRESTIVISSLYAGTIIDRGGVNGNRGRHPDPRTPSAKTETHFRNAMTMKRSWIPL